MLFRTGSFKSKLDFVNSDISYMLEINESNEVEALFKFNLTGVEFSRRTKTEKYEIPQVALRLICRNPGRTSDLKQYVNKVKEELFYECTGLWLSDLFHRGYGKPEQILRYILDNPSSYNLGELNVSTEIFRTNNKPNKILNGYKL